MSSRIFRLVIAALLGVGFAESASAREFPFGTYQSRLGGNETSNQWQLNFDKDGHYVLLVNGNTLQPVEKGEFKVERGTITLDAGKGDPPLYRWSIERKQLRLRLVGQPRRFGDEHLTQGPWDKLGDPLPENPLDSINTQSISQELVEWAQHSNREFREIAADRLADQGEAGLPLLVSLLDDESGYIVERAAASLAKMGATAKPAKDALIDVAQHGSGWAAIYATDALVKIDPQAEVIAPSLKRMFQDDSWFIRIAAASKLRDARPDETPAVVKVLAAMVNSDDKHGRARIADELAKCGPAIGSEGIDALRKLMQDSDDFVRGEAAKATGSLGSVAKDAVPELTALLDDSNSVVRTEAVVALGAIGPAAKVAAPKLLKLMTENHYLSDGKEAKATLEKVAPDELAAHQARPYLIGSGVAGVIVLLVAVFWFLGRRSPTSNSDTSPSP